MFGAGAVAVLSVAIAQICCSCSAVFCCVDAKKSADLISQCCASFDPITKYFLFKFVGLIKQSPHSHSQIKEMYKDFSNRQSALQETLFFFSYIDDTVLVMFLSPRCAHHAPRSRVVLMLWIVEILNFDNDNFLFTGLSRWQLEGHYQLLQSMAFVICFKNLWGNSGSRLPSESHMVSSGFPKVLMYKLKNSLKCLCSEYQMKWKQFSPRIISGYHTHLQFPPAPLLLKSDSVSWVAAKVQKWNGKMWNVKTVWK